MNKISFKGSNVIIGDIVSRIFSPAGEAPQLPERARNRYEKLLETIAAASDLDPVSLGILLDFLIAHGATTAGLDALTAGRADELAGLARDVELLRRFYGDGTITDVRVVDEWPF